MGLQTSGVISLLNIANEFGGSAPHSLSEYFSKDGSPASGVISIGDFYGRSDAVVILPPVWSANSLNTDLAYASVTGIQVSGNSWRWYYRTSANAYYVGPWKTVSAAGNFSGSSYGTSWNGVGWNVSGRLIRARVGASYASSWVTYTRSTSKFTGSSLAVLSGSANLGLDTSSGRIRTKFNNTYNNASGYSYGPWVTLK